MVFFFQILCVLGLVSAGFFARRRGLLSAHGTNDLAHVALSVDHLSQIRVLDRCDLREDVGFGM